MDANKLRLRNTSDCTDDIIGTSSGVTTCTTSMDGIAQLGGQIIINGPKTFELQHRATTTKATDGFGVASNFGVVEVYAHIKITKLK